MPAADIQLHLETPPGGRADGYTRLNLQRATAAAPSVFANIAFPAIVFTKERTPYLDKASAGGATDSWYRWRWENAAGTVVGNWLPLDTGIQGADYELRQKLKRQVPGLSDLATVDTLIDDWVEDALDHLYEQGVKRRGLTQTITPSTTTDEYDVEYPMVEVLGVQEIINGYVHDDLGAEAWEMIGETTLRISDQSTRTGATYRVIGQGYYQYIGELPKRMQTLLFHLVRASYTRYRLDERKDFKGFASESRDDDLDTNQLRQMLAESETKAASIIARILSEETEPGRRVS